jgi:poly-beta-1,6-N-acetyl-D-glucosamine biosynthesis protein PgaD
MGESGPRPEAARALIIERPQLAHPVRRVLAPVFTALAWCVWVALWLPVLAAVSDRFAAALPWASPTGYRSLEALRRLLEVFPLAVGAVVAVLAVNGALTWLHRFLRQAKPRGDVPTRELAAALELPEDELAAWQAARVVRATRSAEGRLVDAQIVR